MVAPLKVGLAGLGTVGASVVRLIARAARRAALRCGRPIEIVAVSARSRGKDRGIDLKIAALGGRSGEARGRSGDRRVRRTDRRRGQSGARPPSPRRSRPASRWSPPTRRCWRATASRLAALAEKHKVALNFEAAVGGAIPIVKTLARRARRQCDRARLRHPQRHLQLHPDPDGAGEADLRRLPEGGAAARLCRGRSVVRRRRPRHRAEARDPGQPDLRHPGRSEVDLCRGHFLDRAGRSRSRRGARLPHQAARRRGEDRPGHRAARASDHGAQGFRHRPGDGRHQRRHHRRRGHRADHAGRAGRRRHGDRLGGGLRHRRHRARRARRAVRPAGRRELTASKKAPMQRHEGGYYIRLLAVDKPGTAATIAKRLAQQHISMESIVQRHRGPPAAAPAKGAVRFP